MRKTGENKNCKENARSQNPCRAMTADLLLCQRLSCRRSRTHGAGKNVGPCSNDPMQSAPPGRKHRRRSVFEITPQDIPWQWKALAMLAFGILLSVVIHESAVNHRHSSQVVESGRIDINFGTTEQLESLPGIGPALARAIIAARPFASAQEISRVRGIGPALVLKLRPLIKAAPGRRTADR